MKTIINISKTNKHLGQQSPETNRFAVEHKQGMGYVNEMRLKV